MGSFIGFPNRSLVLPFTLSLVLDCMMLSSVMIQNPISRKARCLGKRFTAVGAVKDSKHFNPDPQLARTFADLPERKHLIAWPFIGWNLPERRGHNCR